MYQMAEFGSTSTHAWLSPHHYPHYPPGLPLTYPPYIYIYIYNLYTHLPTLANKRHQHGCGLLVFLVISMLAPFLVAGFFKQRHSTHIVEQRVYLLIEVAVVVGGLVSVRERQRQTHRERKG